MEPCLPGVGPSGSPPIPQAEPSFPSQAPLPPPRGVPPGLRSLLPQAFASMVPPPTLALVSSPHLVSTPATTPPTQYFKSREWRMCFLF